MNKNISAGLLAENRRKYILKFSVKLTLNKSIYIRDIKKYEKFKKLHNISFIYNDLNSFLIIMDFILFYCHRFNRKISSRNN